MATTKGQSRRRKPSSSDDGPVAATASTRSRARSQAQKGPGRASPSRNGAEPQALDTETTLDLYRKMNTIRFFEDAAQRGFRQGKVGGYLHLYSGQEAVATGFLSFYQDTDKIITAYRDHAHALLLGSHPNEVMAELYGKGTGLVKGKGGSMHLFDVENGLWGGYGIVGGHIPLGVGFATRRPTASSSSISATAPSTTAPSTRRRTWPGSGAAMA
jgi:TPP-dependent pyruvate/acetoin dehydrogenase alpha subunit